MTAKNARRMVNAFIIVGRGLGGVFWGAVASFLAIAGRFYFTGEPAGLFSDNIMLRAFALTIVLFSALLGIFGCLVGIAEITGHQFARKRRMNEIRVQRRERRKNKISGS